jgi:hypothetical protein
MHASLLPKLSFINGKKQQKSSAKLSFMLLYCLNYHSSMGKNNKNQHVSVQRMVCATAAN